MRMGTIYNKHDGLYNSIMYHLYLYKYISIQHTYLNDHIP